MSYMSLGCEDAMLMAQARTTEDTISRRSSSSAFDHRTRTSTDFSLLIRSSSICHFCLAHRCTRTKVQAACPYKKNTVTSSRVFTSQKRGLCGVDQEGLHASTAYRFLASAKFKTVRPWRLRTSTKPPRARSISTISGSSSTST